MYKYRVIKILTMTETHEFEIEAESMADAMKDAESLIGDNDTYVGDSEVVDDVLISINEIDEEE